MSGATHRIHPAGSRSALCPLLGLSLVLVGASGVLAAGVARGAEPESSPDAGLGEITVTAQKYNSTIQDTPISLSALSGEDLTNAGISSVIDVAREIPGLSMRSAGPGITEYEARGLASTGGAAPTVGFYLDEVPLSPPSVSGSGKFVSDPNLYDIDRVEVLRGPQGTLYGSGSMGGTIKVVTNQPKLGEFEGSVQATLSDTQGGNANGGGNLMLNLPLGETMALRVVATDTHRSGWIDQVVVNPFPINPISEPRGNVLAAPIKSVAANGNTEDLYGGRATLLFKPSETLSVSLMGLFQRMEMGAPDLVDSPPGPQYLAHYEPFATPEPITDDLQVYALTINAHFDFADLTSATSYYDRHFKQTQDATESTYVTDGGPAGSLTLLPMPLTEFDPTHQVTQEIRLASTTSDVLHWVAGAFYSNLTSSWEEQQANVQETAAPNGVIFDATNPYNIKQAALFADGSYKFAKAWTFAAGLRWYDYKTRVDETEWGYFAPNPYQPSTPSVTQASNHGFNPRFNLSYEPSSTLNTYVTAAKGFRLGGANVTLPPPNLPPYCPADYPRTFGPDTVWNYEIGEKARLLDNRLSINSDVFYIKWDQVQQIALLTCGYDYTTNAGNGRSFGPELEITAKITDALTFSASGTYTDAKLTDPTAAYTSSLYYTNGQSYCAGGGTCTVPILNIPRETAAASVSYSTEVIPGFRLTARAADTFVGKVVDESYYFGIQLPSYSIASARLQLAHDRWSMNLFIDNLTNKLALISANNTSFQFNVPQLIRYSVNQPRTFGTQVNYSF
jgi:iron complex outermembrane recepter protein